MSEKQDITEHLRVGTSRYAGESKDQAARRRIEELLEAADLIESFRAQIQKMREALEPFAVIAASFNGRPDNTAVYANLLDCRCAHKALSAHPEKEKE